MFTLSPPFWGAEQGDPYWSYVVALLHFDGNYVDSSPVGGTYSGAAITTTNQRFGSGGLDCTGGTSERVNGGGVALALGTADFCVEFFFKDPDTPAKNTNLFLLQSAATSQSVRVYTPSPGTLAADVSGVSPAGSVAYSYNTWYHVAVTRNGTSFTMWLNGVAAQTWTNSTLDMPGNITAWIGSASSGGSGLAAYLDEWRITAGVPRYTAPFTPSGPFPNRGL